MKIRIVSVGKPHDKQYAAAIADFEQRLRRYVRLVWEFIPASTVEEESAQLLKRRSEVTILLDERGQQLDNALLVTFVEDANNRAVKELAIFIGGAFGVTETVRQEVDAVWSFSKLVFPHQLVRLLLIEQLYRTYDTLSGGKYHHS